MSSLTQVPLFDFMVVRPAASLTGEASRCRFVRDTVFSKEAGSVDVDLQSTDGPSGIGSLIYRKIFCEAMGPDDPQAVQKIIDALIARLPVFAPPCGQAASGQTNATNNGPKPLQIGELQRRPYIRRGDLFYLLPDSIEAAGVPQAQLLRRLMTVLAQAATASPYSEEGLIDAVRQAFGGAQPQAVVYSVAGPYVAYSEWYRTTKRALFDALYMLYVLRRIVSVDMEPLMNGLRALHLLNALAIDRLYAMALEGVLSADDGQLLAALALDYPDLSDWRGNAALVGFPLAGSEVQLQDHLQALPVVHPMFAQLQHFARPFNTVRPIGVGDLKLVKQWLVKYEAGEIADIHNIMKGEVKSRVHRALEKSEDTFSSSITTSQDNSRDTQTTDRFEVKREAESIIKSDLNVNANVRAQYDGRPVLVAVGAGFAYNQSNSNQDKLSQNYSREVVDKAVSRVQSSTVQQRSSTRLLETEETNTHGLSNTEPGASHVSGIYRWVEKHYRAQVFNYGKRLMFEFVLPEPAALLVESRLRNFEATLDVPLRPDRIDAEALTLTFEPKDIDEAKFQQLRQKYELSGFAFPQRTRTVALADRATSQAFFAEKDINAVGVWVTRSYACKTDAKGYDVMKGRMNGSLYYKVDGDGQWKHREFLTITLDGREVHKGEFTGVDYKAMYSPNDDFTANPADTPLFTFDRDEVTLELGFQMIDRFALELSLDLQISATALLDWQTSVFTAVRKIEQARIDDTNAQRQQAYDAALAAYHARLTQLRATAIHDLMQGQSEAVNRELINTELRRQCVAMIAKEFDSNATDDLLTDWETMGSRRVEVPYRRFTVNETTVETQVGFETTPHAVDYPLPKLAEARAKGRFVQFLEQAFEWHRMGYTCYPYFWATPPKWIDLMNRSDDADPGLTAFLRAGAIKVLLAVTPAYDQAVLHFLATREPWEGGSSPAIGDPLYLPLFDELRTQQDDRAGAVAEGEPWDFSLPTSLVYLEGSSTALPAVPQP